ncbi:preprotein translocase subunit SecG [Candidatus Berkelbacteria bacterium]|nr:preprotein translocase subunit SecG [Candidatus Berkelbacteria bacterium]
MNTELILNIVTVIVSVLLMASILIQQQGTGLGGAFGGGGNVYRSKRGIERALFRATIVLAIFFVIVAFANLLLSA